MSNKCLRLAAATIGVVCSGLAGAQSVENEGVTVLGEVRTDGVSLTGLHVELSALDHRADVASCDIQLNGDFSLHDIIPGTYNLFVRTFDGGLVYRDVVNVLQQMNTVTVNLRRPISAAGSSGSTVSMRQLLHPPDRKALQAVTSAQHFAQSGQTLKAMEELEKAIKISPDYAEAYNNLGVQEMHAGKMEEACVNFRKALDITGPTALVLANLAIAQREMKNYPEAIENARAALNLNRGFLPAHLVLGAVLIVNPQTRQEGISHLKLAAEKMDAARTLLERVGQLQATAR